MRIHSLVSAFNAFVSHIIIGVSGFTYPKSRRENFLSILNTKYVLLLCVYKNIHKQ